MLSILRILKMSRDVLCRGADYNQIVSNKQEGKTKSECLPVQAAADRILRGRSDKQLFHRKFLPRWWLINRLLNRDHLQANLVARSHLFHITGKSGQKLFGGKCNL